MDRRVMAGAVLVAAAGCGGPSRGAADAGSPMPEVVARTIEFTGGDPHEGDATTVTNSSLAGRLQPGATRGVGRVDYVVTGTIGPERTPRRVRLTNDGVEEWRDGEPYALDDEGARRARAFVDARMFFPLLPFTLKGGDIRFEDFGLETWGGRELHKVGVSFTPGSSNDADDGYLVWFDPDTGRMEQFGYDFDGGLRFRKATEFERVGGVLFSTQENYAVDGERVPVAVLTPEYVAAEMELLSTVVVSDITVEPL